MIYLLLLYYNYVDITTWKIGCVFYPSQLQTKFNKKNVYLYQNLFFLLLSESYAVSIKFGDNESPKSKRKI